MKKSRIILLLSVVMLIVVMSGINVCAATVTASQLDWYVVDHTNVQASAQSTDQYLITYYSDPHATTNLDASTSMYRTRHINVASSTVTFYGYGVPAFTDFLFSSNSTNETKTFTFSLDESQASFHTVKSTGFLFNANYTITNNTRVVSGYFVAISDSNGDAYADSYRLYKLENVDVSKFNSVNSVVPLESLSSSGVSIVGTVTMTTLASGRSQIHYIKIIASATNVKMYDFKDSSFSISNFSSNDGLVVNEPITDFSGSYGFGPMTAYAQHSCSQVSKVIYNDITLSSGSIVAQINADPVSVAVESVPEPSKLEIETENTVPDKNWQLDDASYKLSLPAQWMSDSRRIIVRIDPVEVAIKDQQPTVLAKAELATINKNLIKAWDVTAYQRVITDSSDIESEIPADQFVGNLVIRVPFDKAWSKYGSVEIVYIDQNGKTATVNSQIVEVNGVKFIQFENNNFTSYYGLVVHGAALDMPATGEKDYTLIGLILLVISIGMGYSILKKAKSTQI